MELPKLQDDESMSTRPVRTRIRRRPASFTNKPVRTFSGIPVLLVLLSWLHTNRCLSFETSRGILQVSSTNNARNRWLLVATPCLGKHCPRSTEENPTALFSSSPSDPDKPKRQPSKVGVQEERKYTPWKGHGILNNRQYKTNASNQRARRKNESSAAGFNKWLQDNAKSTNASNVQMAEDALWARIQSGDPHSYNTVSFNIVLNAWAHQKSAYAANRADELLHKLLALQQQSSQDHLQADTYSYSAVLNAYAKSNGGKTAALRAEELLIQMQTTLFPAHSITNLKTDVCHTAVINAWSVSGDPQAGERAESILRSLRFPSQIPYNACIKAYARSHAPIEAQRLLEEMRNLANSSHPELEPDKISISTCIDAWSKWNKNLTHAAQRAEELLQQMERDYEVWNKTQRAAPEFERVADSKKHPSTSSSKQPDIVTYTAVLTAYARAGLADADKALQLIRRMEKYSNDRPNAPFFNTVIHALAKSQGSRGNTSSSTPQQLAEAVLRHMKKEFYESCKEDIRPDKITYTAVIAVYGSHYDRGLAAAKRAEALLNELEHLYNNTNLDLYLPNTKTFGAVLSVWAKAACMSMSHEEDESISAEWLWHRTESLLERMERLYHRTHSEELKPTSILYSQVFRILANGRDPHAATRGLKLMQKMKSMIADKTGYADKIHLDSTMYAYLIVTFTKSKVENVVEVATQILQQVEEGYKAGMGSLKPTSLLYSAVLQAYAKSSSREGAILAENLLERTKMLYKEGKLYAKPTTLFYNAVVVRELGGIFRVTVPCTSSNPFLIGVAFVWVATGRARKIRRGPGGCRESRAVVAGDGAAWPSWRPGTSA
jgi:Pentatricopeptide repeat domain/PPR repeat